jgi:hypothetical protein
MKKVILALFAATTSWGYTSLVVPAGAFVRITVPAGAPFSSFGDYRIEARFDNVQLPASGTQTILVLGRTRFTIDPSGNLCGINDGDLENNGSIECATLTAGSDVAVRMQRFGATEPIRPGFPGTAWYEVYNLVTKAWIPITCGGWKQGCLITTANSVNISGTGSVHGETNGVGNANVAVSLAYLKLFSTTVHPNSPNDGSQAYAYPVGEATQADLLDLRWEGGYTDSSSGAYGFTVGTTAGAPTTSTTSTVQAPMCSIIRQIFNKNFGTSTLQPTAYPLDPSGTLTYAWSQLSGPSTLSFSNTAIANPNLTGAVFGSYVLQLIATDGNAHASTCSVKNGFVDADSNNMAITPNSQMNEIFTGSTTGRQPMLGTDLWTWKDDREVDELNLQIAKSYATLGINGTATWDSPLAGHIAVTNNSATITGFGTAFQSTLCTGTSPNGFLVIWYPWANAINGHGWRTMNISSCASDTSLTMTGSWITTYLGVSGNSATCTTGGEASCWQYAFISYDQYNYIFQQNSPPDFYGAHVLAPASMYYRSGIDDYYLFAQRSADAWWKIRLDAGNNYLFGESRNNFSLYLDHLGMVWRAIDCPACLMWDGVERMAKYSNDQFNAFSYTGGNWKQIGGSEDADPRDAGNYTLSMSACAAYDPTAGAATCRGYLSTVMNNGWTPSRFPDGNFYSFYFMGNQSGSPGIPYNSWQSGTSATLTNGSSTASCSGASPCTWPPLPPVITNGGSAGTSSYCYTVTDNAVANPIQSDWGCTATGNATLSGTNFNIVTMPTITGHTYSLYRAQGGGTGLISTFTASIGSTVVNDTGLTASGNVPNQPNMFSMSAGAVGGTMHQVWWFFNTPGSMPLDNTGSAGVFYPVQLTQTTIQLQDLHGNVVTFPGTTGTYGWTIGGPTGAVGYGVQPYMLGFLSSAFVFTEKGMRCTSVGVPSGCSNTIADNAKAYVAQIANYMINSGYDATWRGLYYWTGVNCPVPVDPINYQCRDGDGEIASRLLSEEGQRVILNAYIYSRDPAVRTFGDLLTNGEWHKPGWVSPNPADSGYVYDGIFNQNYADDVGYCSTGSSGQPSKCLGMPFGLGAGSAWGWARQLFNGTSRTGWKGTGTVH